MMKLGPDVLIYHKAVGVPGLMSNKSEMKLLGQYFMKWRQQNAGRMTLPSSGW